MKRKYLFLIIPILALALFAALVPFEAERGEISVTTAADGTLLPSDELDSAAADFLNEQIELYAENTEAVSVGSALHWVRYRTLLGRQTGMYYLLPCVRLKAPDVSGSHVEHWDADLRVICMQMKNGQLQSAEDKVQLFDGNGSVSVDGNVNLEEYSEDLMRDDWFTVEIKYDFRGILRANCTFETITINHVNWEFLARDWGEDVPAGSTVTVNASWSTKAKIGSSKIDCGETTVSYTYQTANNS